MGLRLGLMLQFKKLQWGTLKIATIESSLSFFTLFRMTEFSNTLLGTNEFLKVFRHLEVFQTLKHLRSFIAMEGSGSEPGLLVIVGDFFHHVQCFLKGYLKNYVEDYLGNPLHKKFEAITLPN